MIDELAPQAGDLIIEKRMLSAFFASDLDFSLRQKGIETLIVTGVATWACVLKTAYDAVELGYKVVVPADCCASVSLEDHEAAIRLFGCMRIGANSVMDVIRTL